MSLIRKISRSEINDLPSSLKENEDVPFQLPQLEFDFIEVDHQEENSQPQSEPDEVEFPLFQVLPESENGERGRTALQKISLREPSVERIVQSRPDSYYFTTKDDDEHKRVLEVAISGDDIVKNSQIRLPDSHPWRVIDLKEHNDKIEQEKLKKKTKQRPGKKKRENIIKSRERKAERLKIKKQLEKELKRKLMKKIHHKRGGKKNKKLNNKPGKVTKPKYKTE